MGPHYGNDQSLFDYGPDCRDANEFLLERNGRFGEQGNSVPAAGRPAVGRSQFPLRRSR